MRKLRKLTIPAFLISILAIVNGFVDREMANPSPHGYIEVFVALPQVLLGGLLLVGWLLSTLKVPWIRIAGLGIMAIAGMALALFYAFYFMALLEA